jgi:hypothetical protein
VSSKDTLPPAASAVDTARARAAMTATPIRTNPMLAREGRA